MANDDHRHCIHGDTLFIPWEHRSLSRMPSVIASRESMGGCGFTAIIGRPPMGAMSHKRTSCHIDLLPGPAPSFLELSLLDP